MSQEKIIKPTLAKSPRKNTRTAILGTLALLTGLTLLSLRNWLPQYAFQSILVLRPNSSISNTWSKMPVTIPTDVYFFNWTNPDDFDVTNIKPKFVQVGPYRFLQNMEKTNIIWNDNDTVTFNQVRYWQFDDKFTKGKLRDKITSMNAITLGASHHIRNWNYVIKRAASVLLTTIAPKVYTTRTVGQLLFDGYDDLVVDIAYYFPFLASEIPRLDKFGWFRLINGSESFEGIYNMENGVDGHFDIRQWNYYNVTPYFTGECAKVHGSAGEFYSSNLSKDHIGIFISHLCRYLRFDFEEEVMVNGILGYKFAIDDGVMDNGTRVPGNECFCAGDCIPSGVINVSSCRYGTPTYGSLPHFYKADPIYGNQVEGLDPQKSKHEAYIVLEPKTGIILKAVIRLQLNILAHPIEDISIFQNVRTIFFPLLWIEQDVSLPSDMEILLKIFLYVPYVLCAMGIGLIGLGIYLLTCIACKPILVSKFKSVRKRRECEQSRHISQNKFKSAGCEIK